MRNYGDTCPIAVQAAQGAIALIRLCGKGTLELLAKIFSRPEALLHAQGNTIIYGWIIDLSGSLIDEVLVSVYRAPRSYTGEDGADISCHGGSAVVQTMLTILRKVGFEDALAGEFTFRSFINGKMDLTRCESVMELVSAKSKKGLLHAVKRLSGILEREIKTIREKLLEAVCAAELFLDYPEDEIDEDPLSYRNAAEDALIRLKALTASYSRERLYQEGALAVIAGLPNAGKSSLFNAMVNQERSIVSEIPGTTRDWIEVSLNVQGIPLRLADTAGLREFSLFETTEEAEIQGIKRSRELIEEAGIILYTVDACIGIREEDKKFLAEYSNKPLILVWNKVDLNGQLEIPADFPFVVPVSSKTGTGLDELCTYIAAELTQKIVCSIMTENVGLGTSRQKELAEKAVLLLEEALTLADKDESLDLISSFFREALNLLGEITGEVSSAEILEEMFSRFCLGK
jgi:tRNA modification GTPase